MTAERAFALPDAPADGFEIAAGDELGLTIEVSPRAFGPVEDTLQIVSDAGSDPNRSITLSAVGVCVSSSVDADQDDDGFPDDCDACAGFDDALDADGDGVADGCDACPGADDAVDEDADGVADGCDACPSGNDRVPETP